MTTGIPPSGPGDVDNPDSRTARKAQTRAGIARTARQLFAERGFDAVTVAEVATAACVSAQTVYNHFATKEDLFFEGRSGWVENPAEAVRSRDPGTAPLSALRDHLIETVWDTVYLDSGPDGQAHTAALDASPALRLHELALLHEAERQLAQELEHAWASESDDELTAAGLPGRTTSAPLVAATWLAAARVVVAEHRSVGPDPSETASQAAALIDHILCRLEIGW
jgi:AcrR family transcriptional regulator